MCAQSGVGGWEEKVLDKSTLAGWFGVQLDGWERSYLKGLSPQPPPSLYDKIQGSLGQRVTQGTQLGLQVAKWVIERGSFANVVLYFLFPPPLSPRTPVSAPLICPETALASLAQKGRGVQDGRRCL